MSNRHPVFVYGTLMRGQRASAFLQNAEYVGEFCLADYVMYNLGSYPGIKPQKGACVPGELYLVDDKTLERMDRYEGNGDLYNRVNVMVTAGTRTEPAQVYVYARSVEGKPLVQGRWA